MWAAPSQGPAYQSEHKEDSKLSTSIHYSLLFSWGCNVTSHFTPLLSGFPTVRDCPIKLWDKIKPYFLKLLPSCMLSKEWRKLLVRVMRSVDAEEQTGQARPGSVVEPLPGNLVLELKCSVTNRFRPRPQKGRYGKVSLAVWCNLCMEDLALSWGTVSSDLKTEMHVLSEDFLPDSSSHGSWLYHSTKQQEHCGLGLSL